MNLVSRPHRPSARLLLAGALLIPLAGSTATPASMRPMAVPPAVPPHCDISNPPPKPGETVRCEVSLLSHPDATVVTSFAGAVFRDEKLVEVRNLSAADRFAEPGWWQETGSAGAPGTLWWGRSAGGRLWAVGWESRGFLLRHLLRQIGPGNPQAIYTVAQAAKGDIVPFPAATVRYVQVAGPHGAVSGGLGGDGAPFMPAPVSNASLTLDTMPSLQGELQFDIAIEGRLRSFRIPLKRKINEARDGAYPNTDDRFRLMAGDIHRAGGKIGDCAQHVYQQGRCAYDKAAGGIQEYYDATGVFFGANSAYLAVRFTLNVSIPERNKSWSNVDGLVIMRAQP